ncbi:MAG: DUF933 domain-containing protein [Acidobacteriota bacterium]
MKAGIVGLTGAGRRTLFTLLTHVGRAEAGRAAQVGVLKIPDKRLADVARLKGSRKTTPATIEFILIPGLVKGGSKEQLDLPALRNVDVLVEVVRAFEEPSVAHPEGSVNASRDIEVMELELTLADLEVVERRLERLRTDARKGKKLGPEGPCELGLLERARESLAAGTPLRAALTRQEQHQLRGYALLTSKPRLLVVNVGEADAACEDLIGKLHLRRWADAPATGLSFVSARIEAEIAELSPEDASAFRQDLGLREGTSERIVRAALDLMALITFYTAAEKEARAWIVPHGTRALEAAGTVHTDMERGFIRAEVVPYQVLAREESWNACRDKGLLRLEGKDYELADGDVVYFRFHV